MIRLLISVAFAMRCTVAICIAALFLLMGPASMAQSGRVVGRGTTSFGTNPGGKYVYRGGATFGTNPGGKYVYRGGDAKFHTNPAAKLAGTATCPRNRIAMAGDPAIPTGTSSCQLVQESGTVVAVNSITPHQAIELQAR